MKPSTKRGDMKTLFEFATKFSKFSFDGKLYDSIDGVCMGSPLAPLFAETFMQDFEKKHIPLIKPMRIRYWKRYLDDSFVLVFTKKNIYLM